MVLVVVVHLHIHPLLTLPSPNQVLQTALAPPLFAAGHRGEDGRFDGLLLPFARRLGVSAGRRTCTALEKAAGVLGRPRAFLQSAMTRARTDEAALRRGDSFAVGDPVLARGQLGTLVGIHSEGGCTVEFKAGAAYEQVTYQSMRGTPRAAPKPGATGPVRPARPNVAGSARLQHVPLTLEPETRKQSSQATSSETEALIYEHYLTNLARSPHQRDAMSRRVERHVWEREQALILTETYDNLYASFNEKCALPRTRHTRHVHRPAHRTCTAHTHEH